MAPFPVPDQEDFTVVRCGPLASLKSLTEVRRLRWKLSIARAHLEHVPRLYSQCQWNERVAVDVNDGGAK